ncbi:hypothetical protein BVY04_02830 [bacterium M21]|nr:hypothetical protein BVY04_02830 [bacterium M21]
MINRVSGPLDDNLIFTDNDNDKEFAFNLLQDLDRLYSLETMSACMMGNHFHMFWLRMAAALRYILF